MAIVATLVLVFHEDIEQEFGPGPARRTWSAGELEAWLPPRYEEQAREAAGQRPRVVGVRCENRDSLAGLDLPEAPVVRAIAALGTEAFLCEVRVVAGQAQSTKHLCGLNGVRTRDGSVETRPLLLEVECTDER